jgi:hypothetical protein
MRTLFEECQSRAVRRWIAGHFTLLLTYYNPNSAQAKLIKIKCVPVYRFDAIENSSRSPVGSSSTAKSGQSNWVIHNVNNKIQMAVT